jgi:hypothetical protein
MKDQRRINQNKGGVFGKLEAVPLIRPSDTVAFGERRGLYG